MCSMQHTEFKFQLSGNYELSYKGCGGYGRERRNYICHKMSLKRRLIQQKQTSIRSFEERLLLHGYHQKS